MLPQKQKCLARNRIGMLCQCQAVSSGRCRFHSPCLASNTHRPAAPRFSASAHNMVANAGSSSFAGTLASPISSAVSRLLAAFAFWRGRPLPAPARRVRQTPVAFTLRPRTA